MIMLELLSAPLVNAAMRKMKNSSVVAVPPKSDKEPNRNPAPFQKVFKKGRSWLKGRILRSRRSGKCRQRGSLWSTVVS
jgi:hypothetical protein